MGSLTLQGATSGQVTIAPPAVAGTQTQNLQAASGTIPLINSAGALVNTGPFFVNTLSVTTSYSIPSGSSAHSVGPISVASGVTVTVPGGSKWVVL
jgi:hypothetical protein